MLYNKDFQLVSLWDPHFPMVIKLQYFGFSPLIILKIHILNTWVIFMFCYLTSQQHKLKVSINRGCASVAAFFQNKRHVQQQLHIKYLLFCPSPIQNGLRASLKPLVYKILNLHIDIHPFPNYLVFLSLWVLLPKDLQLSVRVLGTRGAEVMEDGFQSG